MPPSRSLGLELSIFGIGHSFKHTTFQKWPEITILAFRKTDLFVYHKMPRGARMGGCTNKAVKIVASEQFDLRRDQKSADGLK